MMERIKKTNMFSDPGTFKKEENSGLLSNYAAEDNSVESALAKRRQKLAEHKIGLSPDSEDTIS